jgi:hypothetical protein
MFDERQKGNRLDPAHVVATILQLSNRIEERFPDARLSQACDELLRLSRETKMRAEWISRPIIGLRIGASVLIVLIAVALVGAFAQLGLSSSQLDVIVFVSFLNAGMNNIVFLAAVVFFLITIEARVKRRRSLIAIHELRSLAHVIDMHQLTKDPDRLLFQESNTKSSPTTDMDVFEMSRYLDYCSEMLSLTGKIAVIYGLHWQDAIAIREANDVERLTTGLSQKIFQKIMILHGSAAVVTGSSNIRVKPVSSFAS